MSNRKILFADDSATMRTIMEKAFMAEPFDVITVPSGEAAIIKAREIHPDVIIADGGMVGVSGYDVCKAIRQDAMLENTPFILMAGISAPFIEKRGEEVGIDEYVKKPFDTAALIASVIALSEMSPTRAQEKVQIPQPTAHSDMAPVGPRPIASPVASMEVVKKTLNYSEVLPISTDDAAEFEPSQQQEDAPIQLPAVQPLEFDDVADAPSAFSVSTLAEMAQMDETGKHFAAEPSDDAIELREEDAVTNDEDEAPPPPVPYATLSDVPHAVVVPIPSVEASVPMTAAQSILQDRVRLAAAEIENKVDGLTEAQLTAIATLTREVIERVVWEVVPELAETIIKEKLAKLLQE